MDYSLPGSSIHRIFQARILEWVTLPSFRGSTWPKDRTHISYISCIGRRFLYHEHTWEVPISYLQTEDPRQTMVKIPVQVQENLCLSWKTGRGREFSLTSPWVLFRSHQCKRSTHSGQESVGRSPGAGNGKPLQYPCLENPMDRGAWWAAVHRVTKSWAQRSN